MLKNKNVLVTGGAGFIGSHLVDKLVSQNNEVIVLDNLLRGNKIDIQTNKNINFINGDIRDFDTVIKATKNVDIIFHIAALARIQPSIKRPQETINANVNGTLNILELARTSTLSPKGKVP